jgi:hypothetical protein
MINERDKATWIITADSHYSASSAYEIQFIARIRLQEIE